ncbi:hypothetical protein Nepgr_012175 [Nepenthes gracilis]|uniref:Cysteine proteinase inhibitor n=1 Tax=Nepenthes gracilis TaxID=150966 RepID=A0AAD3XMX3_NEPGR|nr:hypothetical protein Nepgr_012175 [Nepenthes gracilis]
MALVGGISEKVGRENSLEIDALAKFAVEEHNKKENAMLEFQKVLNTREQVVAGTIITRLLKMDCHE